jgi:tRNA threonylcarbamoyl adenosine modification protein YeaZ
MNNEPITNSQIILCIDTSSNQEIAIGIDINGKKDEIREAIGKQKSQIILSRIQALFEKHQCCYTTLTGITVVLGPGSFTGLRVGVAIANTLGAILQIPINGLPVGQLVDPIYS